MYDHCIGSIKGETLLSETPKNDDDLIALLKLSPMATLVGDPIDIKELEVEDEDDYFQTSENVDFEQQIEAIAHSSIKNCRLVSMRSRFIETISEIERIEPFKDGVSAVKWKLFDWIDGGPVAGSTLIQGLLFFHVDWGVFKKEKLEEVRQILKKRRVWFEGFGSESIVNIRGVQQIKGIEFEKLINPVQWKSSDFKREHRTIPRRAIGDYGVTSKVWQHKSGNNKDPNCGILNNKWMDFECCLGQKRLTFKGRIEAVLNGNHELLGIKSLPSILNTTIDELRRELRDKFNNNLDKYLESKNLHEYDLANEVMHISAGHQKLIWRGLCNDKTLFDEAAALARIEQLISRQSGKSQWSFSDWAYVFVNFENTIMPFIRRQHLVVRYMLSSWRDCRMGLYSTTRATKEAKCFLVVSILIHALLCCIIFGETIMKLHLHILLFHVPQDVEELAEEGIVLADLHAEECEQVFHFSNRVADYLSNHDRELILIEILLRKSFREKLIPCWQQKKTSIARISKLLSGIQYYSPIIPTALYQNYATFIEKFTTQHLLQYSEFMRKDSSGLMYQTHNEFRLSEPLVIEPHQIAIEKPKQQKARCSVCGKVASRECGKCAVHCNASCDYHKKAAAAKKTAQNKK